MSNQIDLTDDDLDAIAKNLVDSEIRTDDLLGEDGDDETEFGAVELTDRDAIEYALDELSGADCARVEKIIEASPEARLEMDWLRREAEMWKGQEGEARLRRLARNIALRSTPLRALVARLGELAEAGLAALKSSLEVNIPLAVQAQQDWIADGESDDTLIRWQLRHVEGAALAISLSSSATVLEGVTVRLSIFGWSADAILRRINPQEVGAEVIIPRESREAAGRTPQVLIQVVHQTDRSRGEDEA
jgi:hypothetical protein